MFGSPACPDCLKRKCRLDDFVRYLTLFGPNFSKTNRKCFKTFLSKMFPKKLGGKKFNQYSFWLIPAGTNFYGFRTVSHSHTSLQHSPQLKLRNNYSHGVMTTAHTYYPFSLIITFRPPPLSWILLRRLYITSAFCTRVKSKTSTTWWYPAVRELFKSVALLKNS